MCGAFCKRVEKERRFVLVVGTSAEFTPQVNKTKSLVILPDMRFSCFCGQSQLNKKSHTPRDDETRRRDRQDEFLCRRGRGDASTSHNVNHEFPPFFVTVFRKLQEGRMRSRTRRLEGDERISSCPELLYGNRTNTSSSFLSASRGVVTTKEETPKFDTNS